MNMLFYLEVSQLSQWKVSDIPIDINGLQDIVCAHVHAQLLQSCPTLCDAMDCSLPGFFVHGIFQSRILEWVDMPSSRGSFWPRDQTRVSCFAGRFFTHWATWEALQDIQFSSVQLLSRVYLFVTPWITARQACLSITNSWSLPKLMSIKLVMPSSHLILCHPLLLLPPIPPSIRVFSNESTLRMSWPKYWSFSFNISPSNEHPGLISFRRYLLDLLAVQGTLKSLFQHRSSKVSILWHSAFLTVQLSHTYKTTGKTIALTRWTFGKVMSLLLNMLSRLVITFLPGSKHLLISWLQSPSAVILEPHKIKSDTVSTVSPSICHEVMGPDAMILVFWMLSFKPTFSLSSFTFIKRLFSSFSLSAIRAYLHIWGYWYFSRQSWFQLVLLPASISHDVLCM